MILWLLGLLWFEHTGEAIDNEFLALGILMMWIDLTPASRSGWRLSWRHGEGWKWRRFSDETAPPL